MRKPLVALALFAIAWMGGALLAGQHAPAYQPAPQRQHYSYADTGHTSASLPQRGYAAPATRPESPGVAMFVPLTSVLPAVAHASQLHVAAYFLDERSKIVGAMLTDARNNPNVETVLTGDGERYAVDDNQTLKGKYPQLHVTLTAEPSHLKAIFVDGQAYLGDRNFGRGTLLLHVPANEAPDVDAAILGRTDQAGPLAFQKALAQQQEVATIDTAHSSILIESESFDDSGPVYSALERAITRGATVAIKAKIGEAQVGALASLVAKNPRNVHYELVAASDKILVVDASAGWVGSANETGELPQQRDWGYASNDRSFVETLTQQFNNNG